MNKVCLLDCEAAKELEKEIKRLGLSLDHTGYMQGLINNLREGYNIPKEAGSDSLYG